MSATISVSLYPNVPNLPGVPQLARSLLAPASPAPTIASAASQGTLWQASQQNPVWGIADMDGNIAVAADSVMTFDWRKEYNISKFPVQQGQFASYNKVAIPFETSVILVKGGSLTDRQNFLAQIDVVVDALALYQILTPEKIYTPCNCYRAELARRGASYANFVEVELYFEEVAQVTAQYSTTAPQQTSLANASVPSALPTSNQGLLQPQPVSTDLETQIFNNLTGGTG